MIYIMLILRPPAACGVSKKLCLITLIYSLSCLSWYSRPHSANDRTSPQHEGRGSHCVAAYTYMFTRKLIQVMQFGPRPQGGASRDIMLLLAGVLLLHFVLIPCLCRQKTEKVYWIVLASLQLRPGRNVAGERPTLSLISVKSSLYPVFISNDII